MTAAGVGYCWGGNDLGQLGDGTRGSAANDHSADRASPVAISNGLVFSSISAGNSSTCGLTKAGAAYCWGSINGATTPQPVGGTTTFASISMDYAHACALTASYMAYCWGSNFAGQLGDGTTNASTFPVAVGGGKAFATITLGDAHTCGVTIDGAAFCWGWNSYGQIGDGTTSSRGTPVTVTATGGLKFARLAARSGHTCGLATSGTVYCWGRNSSGQFGDGTTASRLVPGLTGGGMAVTSLVAGGGHVCGLTSAGIAYCWGGNPNGQIGDGTTGSSYDDHSADRLVPTAVDVSAIPVTTTILAIRVANVRDTSFTVSWVTDVASTGSVSWRPGTSTASPTFAVDVRGADTSSTVHQVTVTGLAASTRYLFDVTSGATTETNGGAHFAVTTGPILSIPATDSVYGTVVRKDGTTPSAVTIHLTASGSAGTSAPISTLVRTADAKAWLLGLGNLRTADASAAFAYTDATILTVQADGGADGTAVGTVTVADARTGKLALTLSDEIATPLQTGWNLVALQVTPASPVTAMALCASLDATVAGSAYEIDRWENSGWESHRCGLAPNNFTLDPGRGYFIRVTKPVTWSVGGTRIITPPSLSLGTGWNLVGVGAVAPGTVTAPSGCTAMDGTAGTGTVVELDRWEAGAWEGHRCGLPVNAFPLQAGRGYFVRLTRPAIWAPAGGAP